MENVGNASGQAADGVAARILRVAEKQAAELTQTLSHLSQQIEALQRPRVESPRVQPVLLTVEDAADALAVSRTAIFGLIGTGEIQSVKIGSRRRIPRSALMAYAARINSAIQ
jgi:excisionase family DNA binding protein